MSERIPLSEPQWFVAMCAPQREAKVAAELTRLGYWCVYPFDRYRQVRAMPGGRSRVEYVSKPRFPRYLFVALRYREESISPVNDADGVCRVLASQYTGEPLRMPGKLIDDLLDERLAVTETGAVLLSYIVEEANVRMFLNRHTRRWAIRPIAA